MVSEGIRVEDTVVVSSDVRVLNKDEVAVNLNEYRRFLEDIGMYVHKMHEWPSKNWRECAYYPCRKLREEIDRRTGR